VLESIRVWLAPILLVTLAACGGTPAAAPASTPATSSPAGKASSAVAGGSAAATPPASPSATASGAAQSGLVDVSVAYANISGSNLTLFVTNDGGYFKKNGLNVTLDFINGGSKSMAALVSNQVQIAMVGGSELVSANAHGSDLVTVATLTPLMPYKFEAASDIKTFDDLRGKPVGISSIGGAVDIATQLLLERHNMTEKDIVPVPDNGSSFRMNALLGGAVKAAMADPPTLVKIEAQGFHPLADLAQEKIPTANTGVSALRPWLTDNKATMQKFVDALIEGTQRAKHDKAFAIDTLKKHFKTNSDQGMQETYDFFIGEIAPDLPYATPEQYADSIRILAEKDAKVKGFDISKYIDSTFVKNAASRGVERQPVSS
jgi:NitT/TauT family transport system substrate-binding protein